MPLGLRLLFHISLVSTVICGAIHMASFLGIPLAPIVFLVLLFCVALLFIVWPLTIWQWRRVPRRNLVSEIFGSISRMTKLVVIVLIVYAFTNFFVCRMLNEWGEPAKLPDGRLVLQTKTRIVRDLSPSEYQTAQARQARMLSGHLLVFFWLAAITLRGVWIKTGPAMADTRIQPELQ